MPDNVSKKADPWIGDIPQDWNRFRIKDIAEISPGFSDFVPTSNEKCVVVPMEALSEKGEIHASLIQEFQDIQPGLTNFEEGDVLFAKITPCMENGKGAFIDHLPTRYGFGSTEFHVLRPGQKLNGKFLYYFTFNPVYRQYAADNMTGAAGQKRVSTKFLAYTPIFLPLFIEQQRIAAYLDKACAAIDGAIQAKRRQLEVLDDLRKSIIHKAVTRGLDEKSTLVDSGIGWLGQVPGHWKVLPFKQVFKLIYRYPTYYDIDYVDEGIPEIRGEALGQNGVILKLDSERYIAPETNDQFPQTRLELGDIVMSVRGTMGKIGLVDQRYIKANITANLLRLSPRRGIASGDFLRWLFLSHYFAECLVSTSPQTTIKTVTMPQLATIRLPIPPVLEQLYISQYLEKEVRGIGDLKKSLKNQIATLEQYRKSLIHECVMGKRRIEEADLATG